MLGDDKSPSNQRQATLTPEQREAEQQENEFEQRKFSAELFSRQYILKFLKHPVDASFGFWDTPTITWNPEHDTFFVSSKVKAKNDFGAELTYQWATILHLDGNTWELVSCEIDGETVYSSETLRNKLTARKQLQDSKQQAAAKRAKAEEKKKLRAEIEESKWRTWTDVKGKHTIEAKFGGMAFGTVTLTKRDGTSIKVPLEKLSDEDRKWIAERDFISQ